MNDNKKVVCWDILEHLKTEKKFKMLLFEN